MDHFGSKSKSVGRSLENPCENSGADKFGQMFIRHAQNDHFENICQGQIWIMSG